MKLIDLFSLPDTVGRNAVITLLFVAALLSSLTYMIARTFGRLVMLMSVSLPLIIIFYALVYLKLDLTGPEGENIKNLPTMIYYSLVTFTTLGYGEITPTSTAARLMAGSEALIGLLYTGILIGSTMAIVIRWKERNIYKDHEKIESIKEAADKSNQDLEEIKKQMISYTFSLKDVDGKTLEISGDNLSVDSEVWNLDFIAGEHMTIDSDVALELSDNKLILSTKEDKP